MSTVLRMSIARPIAWLCATPMTGRSQSSIEVMAFWKRWISSYKQSAFRPASSEPPTASISAESCTFMSGATYSRGRP